LKETALKKLNSASNISQVTTIENRKPDLKKIIFQVLASEAIVLATNKILKEKSVEKAVQGSHENLLTVSMHFFNYQQTNRLIVV